VFARSWASDGGETGAPLGDIGIFGSAPTPDCRIFSITTEIICFNVSRSAEESISQEKMKNTKYQIYLESVLDYFHADTHFDCHSCWKAHSKIGSGDSHRQQYPSGKQLKLDHLLLDNSKVLLEDFW
jgi:hypothetical protein